MPDISFLRKNVRGIKGVFLIREGKVLEVDIEPERDMTQLSENISFLTDVMRDMKGDLKTLSIVGNDRFFIYSHDPNVLGVIAESDINVPLLNMAARRMLEQMEKTLGQPPEGAPRAVEDIVPFFDRPREEVLPNVPEYARQVLEYVDGSRTIGEIIRRSKLPPEVVFDVIFSFRRTSVIHYRQ